jgi:hypothetical protein
MLHGIAPNPKVAGAVSVSRLHRMQGIIKAAVLLLDGTGDHQLNRISFSNRLQHVAVRIERNASVTGTRGKSYSRQSITGVDMYGRARCAERRAQAGHLRGELATIAQQMPGPCLVGVTT